MISTAIVLLCVVILYTREQGRAQQGGSPVLGGIDQDHTMVFSYWWGWVGVSKTVLLTQLAPW